MASLLPGLLFLLFAAGLVALLHRLYDRVPLHLAVISAALVLAFFAPALFAGRTVLPVGVLVDEHPFRALVAEREMDPGNLLQGDLVHEIFPAYLQVRRHVAAGEWPLTSPHAGAGMPLLADPQAQVLQPLVWLPSVLPPLDAFAVTLALRLFVALLFTGLLLRRLDLAPAAALAGAVSYGLGGFVVLWLGWPLATSGAALPAILYAVVRVCEDDRRRDLLLLVAALFVLLTGGHPETSLHVLALGAAFGTSRWWAAMPGQRRRILAQGAACGALALALAAPVLLPASHYVPHSLRSELADRTARRMASGPWVPHGWNRSLEDGGPSLVELRLAGQVAARAFGDHRFGDYWGPRNVNMDSGGFAGTLALAGALAALGWGLRRRPGERVMLGALAVSLAVALRLPPLEKLFFSLPLLDRSITFHSRIRVLITFALAYLLAVTLDRWLRGELRPWRWGSAVAAAAAVVTWGYRAHPPPVGADLNWLHATGLTAQLGVLVAALLLTGIAASVAGRNPTTAAGSSLRHRAAAALALLAALELLFFHLPAWPPMPRDLAYPPTPELEWLAQRQRFPGFHRVVGLHDTLRPEISAVYGISGAGIANPLKPAAYAHLLEPLVRRVTGAPERFEARDHPLYDLLGVRYLVVPYGVRPPRHLALRLRGPGGRIYERPHPLPVGWLPARAAACPTPSAGAADAEAEKASAEQQAPASPWLPCLRDVADFRAEARLVAGAALPGGSPGQGAEAWQAQRRDLRWTGLGPRDGAAYRGRAFLLESRLLATRIYQDGGWRVLVGGRPVPTVLANGPFVAAWLPPGDHPVEGVYRPPGFLAGVLLAALGLAATLAWLVPAPRRFA